MFGNCLGEVISTCSDPRFGGTLDRFHRDVGRWFALKNGEMRRSAHQHRVSAHVYRRWSLDAENMEQVLERLAQEASENEGPDVRVLHDERSSGFISIFGAADTSLFYDASEAFPRHSRLSSEHRLYFDPVNLRARLLMVSSGADVAQHMSVLHCDVDLVSAENYWRRFSAGTAVSFLQTSKASITPSSNFHLFRARRFQPNCRQTQDEQRNLVRAVGLRRTSSGRSSSGLGRSSSDGATRTDSDGGRVSALFSALSVTPHVFAALYAKVRDFQLCEREYPLFKYGGMGGGSNGAKVLVAAPAVENRLEQASLAALCAEWKRAHLRQVGRETGHPGLTGRSTTVTGPPDTTAGRGGLSPPPQGGASKGWTLFAVCSESCKNRVTGYSVVESDAGTHRAPQIERFFGTAESLRDDLEKAQILREVIRRLRLFVRDHCGLATNREEAPLAPAGATRSGAGNSGVRTHVSSFFCPSAFSVFPFFSVFLSHGQLSGPATAALVEFRAEPVLRAGSSGSRGPSHEQTEFSVVFDSAGAADDFRTSWNDFLHPGWKKRANTSLEREPDTPYMLAAARMLMFFVLFGASWFGLIFLCVCARWLRTRARSRAKVKLAKAALDEDEDGVDEERRLLHSSAHPSVANSDGFSFAKDSSFLGEESMLSSEDFYAAAPDGMSDGSSFGNQTVGPYGGRARGRGEFSFRDRTTRGRATYFLEEEEMVEPRGGNRTTKGRVRPLMLSVAQSERGGGSAGGREIELQDAVGGRGEHL